MRVHAQMLGRYASDAVLMTGARGGLFFAGDAILEWSDAFDAALFYESFLAKGRFRGYLENVPVSLITAPDPAFTGLAALLANGATETAAPGRLA